MAYYSGQAASYQELLNVLVNACVDQGWTWADGILNKGDAFVKFEVSLTGNFTKGSGIIMTGGTGVSSGALVNPSIARPRLGRVGKGLNEVTWPLSYHAHILDTEVYLFINYEVNKYMYLSFGMTVVGGSGMWLAASAPLSEGESSYSGVSITLNSGGQSSGGYVFLSGFFWQTERKSATENQETLCINNIWHGSNNIKINSNYSAQGLIEKQPNGWNGEAIFLPVIPVELVGSSKVSILANIKYAKYLRIDNFEPGQVISLGTEKWKVYPFYKKDRSSRDGGFYWGEGATGTFGWAIRYDGP